MPAAALPPDEAARLACLHAYDILDSACEDAFDGLVRVAARLTGSPIALVSLIDAERQWFKARTGLDVEETPREQAFCAHAILQPDRPLVVADAREDGRFADNPLVTGGPGIRFYAGVPLRSRAERQPLGTLCVIDSRPHDPDPAALESLADLARAVETTLELRRAHLEMRALAMTDALTGLANRAAFEGQLAGAAARHARSGRPWSLLLLDLDGFKRVNDSLGHAAGDAVLRAVGQAASRAIRRGDLAARLGGDEFAALLLDGDGAEAPLAAERVRAAIAAEMAARAWPVTASVGAATCGDGRAAPRAMYELADGLMYRAKRQGGNRVAAGLLRPVPPDQPILLAIQSLS